MTPKRKPGRPAQARSDARYIERTTGTRQKLCYANYEVDL